MTTVMTIMKEKSQNKNGMKNREKVRTMVKKGKEKSMDLRSQALMTADSRSD